MGTRSRLYRPGGRSLHSRQGVSGAAEPYELIEIRSKSATPDRSIYEHASSAGISLPASCLQGSCTSCVGRVLEGKISAAPITGAKASTWLLESSAGKVEQKKQTCLDSQLVREGFVALCCAHPLTDVKIQTHQGPAVRKRKLATK